MSKDFSELESASLAARADMQPAPATEQASTGKQDKFLAYWTSIETDTRKALILGARTDTEKLHDLLRTVYEAATQAERVQAVDLGLAKLTVEQLRARLEQADARIAELEAERVQSSESIEEDMRFQCLLYHYVAVRAKLGDGTVTKDDATDAFRELIAHIDARRATASKAEAPGVACNAALRPVPAMPVDAGVTVSANHLRNWLNIIHDNDYALGDRLQRISSNIQLALQGEDLSKYAAHVVREQVCETIATHSFTRPDGWINLAKPGQSWEEWTKEQGLPTTKGWAIAATTKQGTP